MFKLNAMVILALASYVIAEPLRQRPSGRRVSARQQLLPAPAPTGYPAAGVTPQIPFDLPSETEKPFAAVTPQPDEVYGPPELNGQQPVEAESVALQPEEAYGPPQGEPDEVYGPPEIENVPEIIRDLAEDIDEEINDVIENLDDLDEEVIIEGDDAVISVSSTFEKPARLVYQRFPQSRQAPKAVPARLTKAKIVQPRKFFYTARFQNL